MMSDSGGRHFGPVVFLVVFVCVFFGSCAGAGLLDLPGPEGTLTPVQFCPEGHDTNTCKARINVFVNRLSSDRTVTPFEYNHFDFCANESDGPIMNIGQILSGETIRPSVYDISFKKSVQCKVLCKKTYRSGNPGDPEKLKRLEKGMKLNYQHSWIIDNMPVAFCFINQGNMKVCTTGFPMGCSVTADGKPLDACVLDPRYSMANTFYLFNHVDLEIEYSEREGDTSGAGNIIAIKVIPRSIKHSSEDKVNCGPQAPPMRIKPAEKDFDIVYSYSVKFTKTGIKWSNRWDYILNPTPRSNIMTFSLMNTSVIVFFLSMILGMIFYRIKRKKPINGQENKSLLFKYLNKPLFVKQTDISETGWKVLFGDVFRPPTHPALFSALLGNGTQIFWTALLTLLLACWGVLSPANRGALLSKMVLLYTVCGILGGYMAARIYKMFAGTKVILNLVLTCFLTTGTVFGLFLLANALHWYSGSSMAVPCGTLWMLIGLWLGVSAPLTAFGYLIGYRRKSIENPVKANERARDIPRQKLRLQTVYRHPVASLLLGGILPFGCIFIQLFFILNSLWASQMFYTFGYLTVVFSLFILTSAQATIILCFFHLCGEDYRWWWRSFATSGFTAVYTFLYSCHYLSAKLHLEGRTSFVLYFIYTFIMVFLFFILAGTIGFFSCFFFVRLIYGWQGRQPNSVSVVDEPQKLDSWTDKPGPMEFQDEQPLVHKQHESGVAKPTL